MPFVNQPYHQKIHLHSQLETIISSVSQGPMLRMILFNLSINCLLLIVALVSLYKFPDDNTLSALGTAVLRLIKIIKPESEVVIYWFQKNMNPDKFQGIISDKRKSDYTNEHITIVDHQIKVVSSVNILGLQLDDKLDFTLHISKICNSAANQLKRLLDLKS